MIPKKKENPESSQQSLRSAEDIARKMGETLETPKEQDSISLEIAGVKVFDLVQEPS